MTRHSRRDAYAPSRLQGTGTIISLLQLVIPFVVFARDLRYRAVVLKDVFEVLLEHAQAAPESQLYRMNGEGIARDGVTDAPSQSRVDQLAQARPGTPVTTRQPVPVYAEDKLALLNTAHHDRHTAEHSQVSRSRGSVLSRRCSSSFAPIVHLVAATRSRCAPYPIWRRTWGMPASTGFQMLDGYQPDSKSMSFFDGERLLTRQPR